MCNKWHPLCYKAHSTYSRCVKWEHRPWGMFHRESNHLTLAATATAADPTTSSWKV